MNNDDSVSPHFGRSTLFTAGYGLLVWVEWTLIRTLPVGQLSAVLVCAVLIDLTGLPMLLWYGLMGQPTRGSKVWLLGAGIGFLRVALWVIPEEIGPIELNRAALVALLEGTVVGLALLRGRTGWRVYRTLRLHHDARTALQGSLQSVLGATLTPLLWSEVQVLRFSLFGWWRPSCDVRPHQQPITTHRESGQTALTTVLLLVGLMEGGAVHLLVVRWSPPVAYFLLAVSGYSLLFFIADLVATYTRPSFIDGAVLHLRLGLRWQAQIKCANVKTIHLLTETPRKEAGLLNTALLTAPNVLLTLHEPVWVRGPYGIQRQVSRLALFVDDRQSFQKLVTTIS